MSTSKINNYRFLVLAEWTTTCKNPQNDFQCKPYDDEITLPNANSLDTCLSECEKTAKGTKGCCEWAFWKECYWNVDQPMVKATGTDPNNHYAVLCSSK